MGLFDDLQFKFPAVTTNVFDNTHLPGDTVFRRFICRIRSHAEERRQSINNWPSIKQTKLSPQDTYLYLSDFNPTIIGRRYVSGKRLERAKNCRFDLCPFFSQSVEFLPISRGIRMSK